MKIYGLHSNSLRPPALSAADEAAAAGEEKLPYILLEFEAYVADRVNATTASSTTCDGKRVQVTLCPRRPPHVSYVCVHSPDAAEINMEPNVLAADGDLVLLRLTVGPKGRRIADNTDYYVYRAGAGAGAGAEGPNIGILRYRPAGAGDEAYILAGLDQSKWWQPNGDLDLCLYVSEQGLWKTVDTSLIGEEQHDSEESEDSCHDDDENSDGEEEFRHQNWKVIAVGGDAGTVAFVDLWRGIIFCDVLPALKDQDDIISTLRYVDLPRPPRKDPPQADPRLYRDIAAVGDRIKFVELKVRYVKTYVFNSKGFVYNPFAGNGWMAATWSMPACGSSSEGCWQEHSRGVDSRDMKVDHGMLPEVQNYGGGTQLDPFMGLDCCQPVLSLGGGEGGDVIYFTAKRDRGEANGWVVSVDLENKELLDVAPFVSQRNVSINLAYIHSRISSHL
ncbi:unnamed protein product [Urochloa decumbens]|uniref:DUF1618 domain-containing protein n=1 Tax=Urochloa decumbens TaxID=240449 RepID=A0ABC9DWL9_9POAL